jgi:alpha-ribazole phosphatase/probable phosphoglycerate mutase
MRRVILVRHGATDYAGTFCGQTDPDLNAIGERQAEEVAVSLTASGIQAVYSSDLRRARQTAAKIAEHCDLPHYLLHGLREIAFGEWEGLTWAEIEARWPEDARLWTAQYPNRPAPRGESIHHFNARVLRTMDCILAEADRSVCIVSHGGVIRLALTRVFGVNEERAWALTNGYAQRIEVGGEHEYCNEGRRQGANLAGGRNSRL